MTNSAQLAISDAAEWLGDFHPLAEQLGSAGGLVSLSSVTALLRLAPVQDFQSLRRFLLAYRDQILFPLELRAIRAAHGHASRNELRELIDFDRELGNEPVLRDFASPSHRVGRFQLERLRPLRDQRFIQRYLEAVKRGEAQGWHTLVYGITLALYSLPLRQGLIGYSQQTFRGFIYAAAPSLGLSERQCRTLFDELCERLHDAMEAVVADPAGPAARPV